MKPIYAGRKKKARVFVKRVARGVTSEQHARMKLGAALKAIRKDRGLTLDELADMAGTTTANLSRIEGGQWPRPELLQALASALKIHIYQIFARAEGVVLPTGDATCGEAKVIGAYRAMEPEAKYHLEVVAAALSVKKPEKKDKS